MSQWTAILERHLTELVRQNERLLQLATARGEAMARREVGRLETLLSEEQKVAMAVYEEERRRRFTMIRIGNQFGKKPEQMMTAKLSEVLAWLGTEAAEQLSPLASRLNAVVRRTQQVNQESALLAQRFLPYFEEMLGVLVEGTVGQKSYTPAGQSARAGSANMNLLDVTV